MEECMPGLAAQPNGVHGGDAAAGAAAPPAVDLSGFSKTELNGRYNIRPDLTPQGQPSYWGPEDKYFIYFVGSLQRWSICGSESYDEVVKGASLGWAFQLEAVHLMQTSHWLERVGEEWSHVCVTAAPFPPVPSQPAQAPQPSWAGLQQPPPPSGPPPPPAPPANSKGGDWDNERGRTGHTGSSSSGTAWEQQQGRDGRSAPDDFAAQEERNVRARTDAGPQWADGASAVAAAQGHTMAAYAQSGQDGLGGALPPGASAVAAAQGHTMAAYAQSGQDGLGGALPPGASAVAAAQGHTMAAYAQSGQDGLGGALPPGASVVAAAIQSQTMCGYTQSAQDGLAGAAVAAAVHAQTMGGYAYGGQDVLGGAAIAAAVQGQTAAGYTYGSQNGLGAGTAAAVQAQAMNGYTYSGQNGLGAGAGAAAQGQTTSGYSYNSQDQNGDLVPVDWASLQLPPFRREFLPYAAANPQEAQARRQELKIEVEEDPAGPGATPFPIRAFADLQCLPSWLHEALRENAWEFPLPIQAQALPILLGGKSLIGIAQTGSGKTASFLLPAVVHVEAQSPLSKQSPGPVVLVLAPTRELAVQISDEATKLLRFSSKSQQHWDGITSVVFYGGGKKWQQLRCFGDHGSHILVSTPGRLLDFMREGMVSLRRVTYLVFDEADRMLDLGFADDMKAISAQVRPERQMAYFSATWPKAVQALACEFCSDAPVRVRVGGAEAAGGEEEAEMDGEGELVPNARDSIVQEVVVMDSDNPDWTAVEEDKMSRIKKHVQQVFQEDPENKVLIFVNEKGQVDRLSNELWDQGYDADGIHSGRKQEMRLEVLERFRQGKVRVLVATDVIGRGLDIPKVSHVVIHSMGNVDDYVHRIGRTGRGKDGKGHALVFFEFYHNRPNCAERLIGVLERANQTVPAGLRKIAEDVASGERGGRNTWSSGGGRSSWGSGGWKDGGNWRSGGGGWKDTSWKDSSWKSSSWKDSNRQES